MKNEVFTYPQELLVTIGRGVRHATIATNLEQEDAAARAGIAQAPLTMPISGRRTLYQFPSPSEATFRGLPGLLSDALPDDFGNALIDSWMARRGLTATTTTCAASPSRADGASLTQRDRTSSHGWLPTRTRVMSLPEQMPVRSACSGPTLTPRQHRGC